MSIGYIYINKKCKTEKVYIGSTKHTILKRFKTHEHEYDTGKNLCTSHEIIKYGDAFCECLEKVNYDDIKTLRNREKEIIQSKKYNTVNIIWSTREEDDTIFKPLSKKKQQKLNEDMETAKHIMKHFDKDKVYTKEEIKQVLKQINMFNELITDNFKKILGKLNTYLKYADVKVEMKQKKIQIDKQRTSTQNYLISPLK